MPLSISPGVRASSRRIAASTTGGMGCRQLGRRPPRTLARTRPAAYAPNRIWTPEPIRCSTALAAVGRVERSGQLCSSPGPGSRPATLPPRTLRRWPARSSFRSGWTRSACRSRSEWLASRHGLGSALDCCASRSSRWSPRSDCKPSWSPRSVRGSAAGLAPGLGRQRRESPALRSSGSARGCLSSGARGALGPGSAAVAGGRRSLCAV